MGWPLDDPSVGDFSGFYALQSQLVGQLEWWEHLVQVTKDVSEVAHEKWEGMAGEAFTESVALISERAQPICSGLETWGSLIKQYIAEVPETIVPEVEKWKRHREDMLADLNAARVQLGCSTDAVWNSTVLVPKIAQIEQEIADANRRIQQYAQARLTAEENLASGIADLGLDYSTLPAHISGFGQGVGGASLPPPEDMMFWMFGTLFDHDADDIRRRWDELSESEKQGLIELNPHTFGNLDGIPLGWRAKANDINIGNYIDELKKLRDEIPSGGYNDAVIAKANKRIAYLESLRHDTDPASRDRREQWHEDGTKTYLDHSQVIAFDPGSDAIAFYHGAFDENGDIPSWYDNVAVNVPGTGSNLYSTSGDHHGSDFYHHANVDGGSKEHPTAVITWQGGRFPQGLEAMDRSYANVLDKQLASFVNAATTPSMSNAAVTVVGHSYGGTVVSQAEVDGMAADRIVYVSSAGMGDADQAAGYRREPTPQPGPPPPGTAESKATPPPAISDVDAFPKTSKSPHYALYGPGDKVVGAIQDDGILEGGMHGRSAHNDPGVIRLETGWMNDKEKSGGLVEDSDGLLDWGRSHSASFEEDSTAFKNIVGVIVGGDVSLDHAKNHGGDGLNPDDKGYEWQYVQVPSKR